MIRTLAARISAAKEKQRAEERENCERAARQRKQTQIAGASNRVIAREARQRARSERALERRNAAEALEIARRKELELKRERVALARERPLSASSAVIRAGHIQRSASI